MLRIAAGVSLFILVSSLVVIYAAQPSLMLLALSGAIILISVVLAIIGKSRETFALGALSLVLSVVAAGILGDNLWGPLSMVLTPLVWVIVLYLSLSWIWVNTIYVSGGTEYIVSHPFGLRRHKGPAQVRPPLPFFEENLAKMPLYEMVSKVEVEKINTRALQNIVEISLEVHYQITEPLKLRSKIPNRTQVMREAAGRMGKPVRQAQMEPAFWEDLVNHYIQDLTDGLLRSIIYDHPEINRAVEASLKRNEWIPEVRGQLSETAQNVGIEIVSLDVEKVDLEPGHIQRHKRPSIIQREKDDAERQATIEAQRIKMIGEAEAVAQATAIGNMIKAIQDQGVNLSAEDIEQIVFSVLEERNERRRNIEIVTRDPERSREFWRGKEGKEGKERAMAK